LKNSRLPPAKNVGREKNGKRRPMFKVWILLAQCTCEVNVKTQKQIFYFGGEKQELVLNLKKRKIVAEKILI